MPFPQRNWSRAACLLALIAVGSCRPPVVQGPIPAGIQTDVAFIGSPRLEGRAVGSAGANRAATYIVDHYKSLSLAGAFRTGCTLQGAACGDGYYQPFTRQNARNAKNIGAVISGTDSALRNEFIVIGAHYDHVGRSRTLSLDPENEDAVRPGADDNASGTAAVMELGRRLAARPPRRSVLLVHFDAEELGLFGSSLFVSAPPVSRRQMKLMLNLDMVGRLRRGGLEIDKSTLVFDDSLLLAVVDSAATALNVRHSFTRDISGRSDHASFRQADISALAFFTGFHGDYHRATDVVSRLDVRGIGQVTDVVEAVVRFAADRP
jgi:Zn-dependent M28 family amino/carboxypeptidase